MKKSFIAVFVLVLLVESASIHTARGQSIAATAVQSVNMATTHTFTLRANANSGTVTGQTARIGQ